MDNSRLKQAKYVVGAICNRSRAFEALDGEQLSAFIRTPDPSLLESSHA